MRTSAAGRRDDRGSATVWAAGLLVLLGFVGCAFAGVGGLLVAHRRVQAAADLAALAGAAAHQRGDDACGAAVTVAERNRATVSSCHPEGADVVVEARVEVDLPGGPYVLRSSARAGPVAP